MNTPHVTSSSEITPLNYYVSYCGIDPLMQKNIFAGWSLDPPIYVRRNVLSQYNAKVESFKKDMEVRLAEHEKQQADLVSQLKALDNQNALLEKKVLVVQKTLNKTQGEISVLQKEFSLSQEVAQAYGRELAALQDNLRQVQGELADTVKATQTNQRDLQDLQVSHSRDVSEIRQTQIALAEQTNQVENTTTHLGIWLILICVLLLAVAITGYVILRKRVRAFLCSLEQQQVESLQQRSEILELISKNMRTADHTSEGTEPDHAPMLKFANEISRMEMNLSRMDPSIKGHKQLTRGLERIRNNLAAAGYEIVPMLGQIYQEGLRVEADFVVDEKLPEGERRITAVTCPQVNYKGVLIQKANITVSQNI